MSVQLKQKILPADTNQPDDKAAIPPLHNGDRLSRPMFEQIYHLHPEIKKAELIEGEVYVASPVQVKKHSRPHFNVISWLGMYMAATPGVSGDDNATVRLDLENEPQPDVMLTLDPDLGGGTQITEDDYLTGVPELVIEVAASSASYDLNKKKRVYARNGVKEYLVFLTFGKSVYWFELGPEGYVAKPADERGILRSKVFPGLWLLPDALWKGDLAIAFAILQEGLATPEHAAFLQKLHGTT